MSAARAACVRLGQKAGVRGPILLPAITRHAPVDRQLAVRTYLQFEKPIAELESKVAELKALENGSNAVSISDEVRKIEQKAHNLLVDTYAKLTPWQKAQVARHPDRPHCVD